MSVYIYIGKLGIEGNKCNKCNSALSALAARVPYRHFCPYHVLFLNDYGLSKLNSDL